MATKLVDLIRGKMAEIVLQHDASRVVQAAIQFGTDEERKEVVMELCKAGNIAELSKVQYAHFAVLKMIKYCYRDADCVRTIAKVRCFFMILFSLGDPRSYIDVMYPLCDAKVSQRGNS